MISMKDFYLIACCCMIVVLGANIWNLILSWGLWNIPATISFIFGSIIFNILLSVFFFGLWKMTPKQIVNNGELDNILKEYEEKSKK